MAQTAFIVRVPEAEAVVGDLRERFDPSASEGVPAHITILYPFMSPELVSGQVVDDVRQALGQMASFHFQLSRIGRFPATTYLAPEPAAAFIALTRCLVERFPAYLPYGGEHEGVVPHLTVSDGSADEASVAEAELMAAMARHGAIASTCAEVALLENSTGTWREMHAFRLSSGDSW